MAVEAFISEVFVFLSCFSYVSEPLPSVAPDQISFAKHPLGPKPSLGREVVRECHSPEA